MNRTTQKAQRCERFLSRPLKQYPPSRIVFCCHCPVLGRQQVVFSAESIISGLPYLSPRRSHSRAMTTSVFALALLILCAYLEDSEPNHLDNSSHKTKRHHSVKNWKAPFSHLSFTIQSTEWQVNFSDFADLLNVLFIYYFNFSFRHLTDWYVVRSLKK